VSFHPAEKSDRLLGWTAGGWLAGLLWRDLGNGILCHSTWAFAVTGIEPWALDVSLVQQTVGFGVR